MTGAFETTLKVLASIMSLGMCLSPVPSIYKIYKTKTIGEVSILPLVSLWAGCFVWMMYGLLIGNLFPLSVTFVVGSLLAIVYIAIYYSVTTEKEYVLKATGAVALFVVLLTAYSVLGRLGATNQSSHDVGQTVGYIGTAVSIIQYASPFETIVQVIRTKSASSIPILMCVAGTINNTLWTLYGFASDDLVLVIPNVICSTCGAVQVVLYAIYKPGPSKVELPASTEIVATTATGDRSPDFHAVQSPRQGDLNC